MIEQPDKTGIVSFIERGLYRIGQAAAGCLVVYHRHAVDEQVAGSGIG